jgi:lipopolysaccharide export system permease protein
MRILDRYIAVHLSFAWLLVVLILAALFSFLDFVEQLEEVGEGGYATKDALTYTLLMLPGRVAGLVPVAALLGTILALGAMARDHELVAMRAAGVAPLRVSGSALRAALLLAVALAVALEALIPRLEQYAHGRRSLALSGDVAMQGQQGFWSRDGMRFVNVRHMLYGRVPADIDIYELTEAGGLHTFTHAEQARRDDAGGWILMDVRQQVVGPGGIDQRELARLPWRAFLSPDQSSALMLPPESLSPSDLVGYVAHLAHSGQRTLPYELALWRKLALPMATLAMALLAVPFVFGPLRTATQGLRLAAGAVLGVGFFLLDQILFQAALLLGLSAPLVALTPTALVLSLALGLGVRVR